MENGVGKKIVTCDDPSSSPPPPTFCPGFPFCDNQGNGGSWPGVDPHRHFLGFRPWPLWPGQQGNWLPSYWPFFWKGQQGNRPQQQVQQHWPTWRATWKFLPHLGRWVRSWWGWFIHSCIESWNDSSILTFKNYYRNSLFFLQIFWVVIIYLFSNILLLKYVLCNFHLLHPLHLFVIEI